MNLAEPVARALSAQGYTTPTPIQAQAVPHGLARRDLLGIAQTGTGKTAAFALPILDRLAREPGRPPLRGCRTLVLAPTRELATQIADSFTALGRFLKLSVGTVFGGMPVNRQVRMLERGLDVLVATPGRLLDLIDQRALTLSDVEVLVLDEADQMLDLGFIHSLKRIVQLLPRRRQTMLFSATMPKAIGELAQRYLTDPVQVAVAAAATTAERVAQRVVFVSQPEKQALLGLTLRDPAINRALVFTRTKHGADRVVKQLAATGIQSAAIHGNKSQPQRERALDAFRSGQCRVLVATDIAARGIDVDAVSHVVNFEIPNVPEQYVHRIGRTARAGAAGEAIAFVSDEERPFLRDIEKLIRSKIPVGDLPPNFVTEVARQRAQKPVELARPAASAQQPGGGGRTQARNAPQKHSGTPRSHGHQPAEARHDARGGAEAASAGRRHGSAAAAGAGSRSDTSRRRSARQR